MYSVDCTHLLHAALEGVGDANRTRHLVKVAMSAHEQVKVECKLGEATFRHAMYSHLVVHL